jgi:hypothetical protein
MGFTMKARLAVGVGVKGCNIGLVVMLCCTDIHHEEERYLVILDINVHYR